MMQAQDLFLMVMEVVVVALQDVLPVHLPQIVRFVTLLMDLNFLEMFVVKLLLILILMELEVVILVFLLFRDVKPVLLIMEKQNVHNVILQLGMCFLESHVVALLVVNSLMEMTVVMLARHFSLDAPLVLLIMKLLSVKHVIRLEDLKFLEFNVVTLMLILIQMEQITVSLAHQLFQDAPLVRSMVEPPCV